MRDGEQIDGRKEGEWVSYYANGNKMSEGRYHAGKKVGPWVQYHPNGNKKSECTFVEGEYSGLYTAYHENGKRFRQGRYNEHNGAASAGTKDGVWCDYEEDGKTVRRKITYKRGSRVKPDEYPPFE